MGITKHNGRVIIYKGGHHHSFKWCAAIVKQGNPHIFFENPDWRVTLAAALAFVGGTYQQFTEWIREYRMQLD